MCTLYDDPLQFDVFSARKAMDEAISKIGVANLGNLRLEFDGLGSFEGKVLFAKVKESPELEKLRQIAGKKSLVIASFQILQGSLYLSTGQRSFLGIWDFTDGRKGFSSPFDPGKIVQGL